MTAKTKEEARKAFHTNIINREGKLFCSPDYALFDAVEVHPMCTISYGPEGRPELDHVDDGDTATAWSVMLHCIGGGTECVADLFDEEQAYRFADILQATLIRYHCEQDTGVQVILMRS
jgi:hypothetical protein